MEIERYLCSKRLKQSLFRVPCKASHRTLGLAAALDCVSSVQVSGAFASTRCFPYSTPLYLIQTWLTYEAGQTFIIIFITFCYWEAHTRLIFLPYLLAVFPRGREVTDASFLWLILVFSQTTLIMTCPLRAVTEGHMVRSHQDKLGQPWINLSMREEAENQSRRQSNTWSYVIYNKWIKTSELSPPRRNHVYIVGVINEISTQPERWGQRWRLAAGKVMNENSDNQKWTFYPYTRLLCFRSCVAVMLNLFLTASRMRNTNKDLLFALYLFIFSDHVIPHDKLFCMFLGALI